MTSEQDDRPFRALFSEQAGRDRRQTPSLEDTLRHTRSRPRIAAGRLALAAGVVLIAGVVFSVAYQGMHQRRGDGVPQAALPNLLETFDNTSLAQWKSPTAFLLDFSNSAAQPDSAPAPDRNQVGPESRQSNG